MKNYIKTIYNDSDKPKTEYPEKLVSYLVDKFNIKSQSEFLEVGCGRAEHLLLFEKKGLKIHALDFSKDAIELNPHLDIKICNLETEKIPYPDNFFDVVYSKSFIEHLDGPLNFMNEARRVLKKGGKLITLVPDWEANYLIYFDDFSHKTPYTKNSLIDLYKMTGFEKIDVFKFRQLPIVWKYPWLNLICRLIAVFTPHRSRIKFLRWSKELMIVGYAEKLTD